MVEALAAEALMPLRWLHKSVTRTYILLIVSIWFHIRGILHRYCI